MRMSKSGRGHWQLRVYAPDTTVYHSLATLLRALEAFSCDAAERQRELLAAVLLQTAFRSFAWARARSRTPRSSRCSRPLAPRR